MSTTQQSRSLPAPQCPTWCVTGSAHPHEAIDPIGSWYVHSSKNLYVENPYAKYPRTQDEVTVEATLFQSFDDSPPEGFVNLEQGEGLPLDKARALAAAITAAADLMDAVLESKRAAQLGSPVSTDPS